MKAKIRVLINLVVISLLMILFQGCTIIGLAIGASSDSKKPDYKTIHSSDTVPVKENARMITTTVRPGEKITVITRDKQNIPGKFKGTVGENDGLALQLSNSDSTIFVPVNNVSKIQMRNGKYGALTGFFIGAVIDGAIIVALAKSMEDSMNLNLGGSY